MSESLSAGGQPGVSLIISSRGRPQLLADAVASVLAGQQVPAEIVIVDQSNIRHPTLGDLTSERGCEVRYRWSHGRGLSRGRNEGIAAARHELLVFIDDDVLVEREWLATLVPKALAAGPRTVVTGRVLPGAAETEDGWAPSTNALETPATYAGRVGRDVLYPHNMCVHRSTFEEVGPFDERLGAGTHYPSSEDNDFCHRLLEAGYRVRYEPMAVVRHRAWRNRQAFLPLRWSYGRGQGAYFAKHLRRDDRYMLRRLVYDLVRHLRRVPRRLARDPRLALGDVVYVLGVVSGAIEWLLTRPPGA